MYKKIKSILYSLFFLYIIYLCIKGLVKLLWRPKSQHDLLTKTKFVFILFFLFSLTFIVITYYLFNYEQVNYIYKVYIYFVLILCIIGILNNEIFNFGYNIPYKKEKTDINELFDYYNKNK